MKTVKERKYNHSNISFHKERKMWETKDISEHADQVQWKNW